MKKLDVITKTEADTSATEYVKKSDQEVMTEPVSQESPLINAMNENSTYSLKKSPLFDNDKDQEVIGVFEMGNTVYFTNQHRIEKYRYQEGAYLMQEEKEIEADAALLSYKSIKAIVTDEGNLHSGFDVVYDESNYYPAELTNAFQDTAYIRLKHLTSFTEDLNFKGDLKTGTYEPVDTKKILDLVVGDRKEMNIVQVTLIALPQNNTLYHIYLWNEKDDMTSLWVVADENEKVINSFETQYFDDLSNVTVNPNGDYIAFSYGQTPGYPHLLDLKNQNVYPIFPEGNDAEEKNAQSASIRFISWQDNNILCLGLMDDDRTIIPVDATKVLSSGTP
jgi:WD40 repeat protein